MGAHNGLSCVLVVDGHRCDDAGMARSLSTWHPSRRRGDPGGGGDCRRDSHQSSRCPAVADADTRHDRRGIRCDRRILGRPRRPWTAELLLGGGHLLDRCGSADACHILRDHAFHGNRGVLGGGGGRRRGSGGFAGTDSRGWRALAAASLAMINAAAKLSIVLTGLSPRMPSSVDAAADEDPLPAGVGALRVARGHQTLTGLLAGFSLSAALGVALVVADRRNHVHVERYRFHRCRFGGTDPARTSSNEDRFVPPQSLLLDLSAPQRVSRFSH